MKISKTAIFLFELMFVILVFSISAAVCSDIFAKAYKMSSDSKNLTTAILKAESAAEEIKADILSDKSLLNHTDTAKHENPVPVYHDMYYDKDWQLCNNKDDSVYTLSRSPSWDNDVFIVTIQVDNDDGHIYDLTVKTYVSQ